MKIIPLIADYGWEVAKWTNQVGYPVPDYYGVYADDATAVCYWIALCTTEEQAKILCEGMK